MTREFETRFVVSVKGVGGGVIWTDATIEDALRDQLKFGICFARHFDKMLLQKDLATGRTLLASEGALIRKSVRCH